MKKLMLFSSFLIMVLIVIYIVSTSRQSSLEIEYVNELEANPQESFKACLMRPDGKLVLIDILQKNNENIYLYVLKIYDHYRNSLPLNYSTPLRGNFEVKKLEKKGRTLEVELEVLYLEANFQIFLTALMWTYQNLGIDYLNLKANQESFHLEKDELINLELNTINLSEANMQVVYYYLEDEILPITYLHNQNQTDFLIKKIISAYLKVEFCYQETSGFLTLQITDPLYEITPLIINSLGDNLNRLGLYNDIVIVKNGLLVYNN